MSKFELYITHNADEFILDSGTFTRHILKSFFKFMKDKKILNNLDRFDEDDNITEYITCDRKGTGYTLKIYRKGV